MFTARFLQPIRVPLAASIAFPHSRLSFYSIVPRYGKFEYLNTWMKLKGLRPQVPYYSHNSNWNLCSIRTYCQYYRIFPNKGYTYNIANVVALCAAFGSISLWPRTAYSLDDFLMLEDNHQSGLLGGSYSKENVRSVLNIIRKLLVPVFLFLTVWLNWGQPINIAIKVLLIILSTKPVPSSVHIFVEQLRNQLMRRHPFLYRFRPLHVKMVEVEDYTVLCVARVEIKDERFVLIGVLGTWWIMPLSSTNEIFLFDTRSWKELFSVVKNRFRLAADLSYH
ncbi:Hypothetical predicted protein [Olea europaea subsp. europaea]|uniref:Uncharacterized protein n=1 Tax=Olea europaea subsp. europaea TaxID=158383 RepID=A0A8S0RTE8_OLEEU|nr:Hypothetical predicted protein [Olea europaea subsp. europaea]